MQRSSSGTAEIGSGAGSGSDGADSRVTIAATEATMSPAPASVPTLSCSLSSAQPSTTATSGLT